MNRINTHQKEKKLEKESEKKLIITDHLIPAILFIAAFLLLSVIPLIREDSKAGTFSSSETYYDLHITNMLRQGTIPQTDPLSPSEGRVVVRPYHFLIATIAEAIGTAQALRLIAPILGVFTILLFYYLLLRLEISSRIRIYSTFLILLSPLFLSVFSVPSDTSFALFCLILGVYSFARSSKPIFLSIALIMFFIIPFYGIAYVTTTCLALILIAQHSVKRRFLAYKKNMILAFFLMGITTIAIAIILTGQISIYDTYTGDSDFMSRVIAEFGLNPGISLFCIILAIYGIFARWDKKALTLTSAGLIVMITYLSVYHNPKLLVIAMITCTMLAALGLEALVKIEWELKLLRNLSLLAIFCGILFSTLSYVDQQGKAQPDQTHLDAITKLESITEGGKILSVYQEGFYIEALANRSVFDDEKMIEPRDSKIRKEIADDIFRSRNLVNTSMLLQNNSIKYIFITPAMRDGEVWKQDDDGLLFVLRNDDFFDLVHEQDGYELWEYLAFEEPRKKS